MVEDSLKDGFEERVKKVFLQRKENNSSYSLRAMARDLGVSHTYLSLALAGKRKFPAVRVLYFCKVLGFSDRETAEFLEHSSKKNIENFGNRREKKTKINYVTIELDRYRVLTEWFHLPILDLTLMKSFKSDEKWVAKQLGITASEVKKAVRRLTRLGLLETVDGRWKKTKAKIAFPTQSSIAAVRKFHEQMIIKSLEALSSNKKQDFDARDISGTTMLINSRRLPLVKRRIQRFRRALSTYLSEGDCDTLYQLNVQLFPLTSSVLN